MMRLRLDTKEHLELVYDLLRGGYDWRDAPERSIAFHEEVRFNIERRIRLYEERIKAKCLEVILTEGLNLSESDLRVLLEKRTNAWIENKSAKEATKAIRIWNHSDERLDFDEDGYLIEKDEPKDPEPYVPTVYCITKNGLDVMIEPKKSMYRSIKDGTVYEIDGRMNLWNKAHHHYLETIVRECAKVGLHVDWILRILRLPKDDRRRIAYLARKFGFEVCQTPRSKFGSMEMIRVLDDDGMFLVEKTNPFRIENDLKSGEK